MTLHVEQASYASTRLHTKHSALAMTQVDLEDGVGPASVALMNFLQVISMYCPCFSQGPGPMTTYQQHIQTSMLQVP